MPLNKGSYGFYLASPGFSMDITPKSDEQSIKRRQSGLLFLLNELTDDDNFFQVCQALFHHDQEISIGASLALGHMKDPRATPYLLRALLTEQEKRAEAIIWALGEIGDEAAVPFLTHALNAQFVPKSAILALGKIGSPDAVETILCNLRDSDEIIRLLAAKALSQIRFNDDFNLIRRICGALNEQLMHECSRRVKLMLSVVRSKLDKAIRQ